MKKNSEIQITESDEDDIFDPQKKEEEYEELEPQSEGGDETDYAVTEHRLTSRPLITQPSDSTIKSLVDQVNDETIVLRPHFQRDYIWSKVAAARLIESLLLNVPIPPCYLAENDDYTLDVVDGQQRIKSITRYMNDEFALTRLQELPHLNGKRFKKLDKKLQKKLESASLRLITIKNASDPEIQFEVFERLNSYTTPLYPQELRNCVFRGKLNDLLIELTEYKPWLDALHRKEPHKRMRDAELILRFFAFQDTGYEGFTSPADKWMNRYAEKGKQKKFSDEEIDRLRCVWKDAVDKCVLVFGAKQAFRRYPPDSKRPKIINKGLMDIALYFMPKISKADLEQNKSQVIKAYQDMFSEPVPEPYSEETYDELIGNFVDRKERLLLRFQIWEEKLKRLGLLR